MTVLPLRRLIVGILITAVCLAGYALFQDAASPPTARPLIAHTGSVPDDALIFEDSAWWWPENIAAAAGMFQCWPAAARGNNAESVVIWTDKANKVIAFGPSLEETLLPAYATALGNAETGQLRQPIQVATQGHILLTSSKKGALQLKDMKLSCVRTWDD